MKKTSVTITLFLIGIVLVLLCGCSPSKKPAAVCNGDDYITDPAKEELIAVMNGSVDLDAMTLDELLDYYDSFLANENDALKEGGLYDLLYKDETVRPDDTTAELDFTYPENAQTAEYSDTPWKDKAFEALDITAGMTPEEKAEYEAMLSELNSINADDIALQFEEILHGIDGFEDYEIDNDDPDDPDDPDIPGIMTEWPDNALGRSVPKPEFSEMTISASDDVISAVSTTATAAEVKAYAAKLKAAGYTENMNESEQTVAGYTIYSFSASGQNGIYVMLQHVQGTMSLSVTRV